MARHASLWLDMRDQFAEEHLEEWEAQKFRMVGLNKLERETGCSPGRLISRQDAKECADSKEAEAEELPPERRAAQVESQACTMPTKVDVSLTNAGVPLYPNWVVRSKTKPTGHDAPKCYRAPREDAVRTLTLAEELDEASVYDPLKLDSQSSQPDAVDSSTLNSPSGAEGPKMPPHYSNASATIPPFDLTQLGILPAMSPVTEKENELLNLAPGSPIKCGGPPGLSQNQNKSERSSYSGSLMLIGSPTGMASIVHALQVHTHPTVPAIFSHRGQPPTQNVEEEMDAAQDNAEEESDED